MKNQSQERQEVSSSYWGSNFLLVFINLNKGGWKTKDLNVSIILFIFLVICYEKQYYKFFLGDYTIQYLPIDLIIGFTLLQNLDLRENCKSSIESLHMYDVGVFYSLFGKHLSLSMCSFLPFILCQGWMHNHVWCY